MEVSPYVLSECTLSDAYRGQQARGKQAYLRPTANVLLRQSPPTASVNTAKKAQGLLMKAMSRQSSRMSR